MTLLEIIRKYRLISVLFVLFSCVLAYNITMWFMGLDNPNNSQSAFASAAVLALIGIGKYWMETKANDNKGDD